MKKFVAVVLTALLLTSFVTAFAESTSTHLAIANALDDISPFIELIKPYENRINSGEILNEIEYKTYRNYIELIGAIEKAVYFESAQAFENKEYESAIPYSTLIDGIDFTFRLWDDMETQYNNGEIEYTKLLSWSVTFANTITNR